MNQQKDCLLKRVDLKALPPFQPRYFVPEDADLTQKETLASLYQQLLDRPVETEQEMEQLILDRSELEAAINQQQAKQDPAKAVHDYKKALVLGGSRPLPELFSAAQLDFDFSEKTIQPLARILLDEWQKQL